MRALGAVRSAEQQSRSRNYRISRNERIPKRSALDPRIEKALQSSARKLPDRKLASEANAVAAPAEPYWSEEARHEGVGRAVRSAEQQSRSRNYRISRNERIPKRSALDPRITKALQSSARKLPDRKLASEANAVAAPAEPYWSEEARHEGVGSRTKR